MLIVSAHWESDELGITSTSPTELVYDFGGFAPVYYRMRYDTPDNSGLAAQLRSVLPEGTRLHEHRDRGLDHPSRHGHHPHPSDHHRRHRCSGPSRQDGDQSVAWPRSG